jgi:hypothetical protein
MALADRTAAPEPDRARRRESTRDCEGMWIEVSVFMVFSVVEEQGPAPWAAGNISAAC